MTTMNAVEMDRLETQINKLRLIKELVLETACAKAPMIFELAGEKDKKAILYGLHQILEETIIAYDALAEAAQPAE